MILGSFAGYVGRFGGFCEFSFDEEAAAKKNQSYLSSRHSTVFTLCNTLQHIATHCNTLQHIATHCNTLQHIATYLSSRHSTVFTLCNTLRHIATHFDTFQHTSRTGIQQSSHSATRCNTQQHIATHCNIPLKQLFNSGTRQQPQGLKLDCNTLQHTATHCNILQQTATHYNSLHHTTPHCTTLHHAAPYYTAPHPNTLQHTFRAGIQQWHPAANLAPQISRALYAVPPPFATSVLQEQASNRAAEGALATPHSHSFF